MESSRCFRFEASAIVKSTSTSLAATLSTSPCFDEASLMKRIDAVVAKSVSRALDRVLDTLVRAIAKVMTEKVSKILEVLKTASIPRVDLDTSQGVCATPAWDSQIACGSVHAVSDITNHTAECGMEIEQSSAKRRIPSQGPSTSDPGFKSRSGKETEGMRDVLAEAVSSILQPPDITDGSLSSPVELQIN